MQLCVSRSYVFSFPTFSNFKSHDPTIPQPFAVFPTHSLSSFFFYKYPFHLSLFTFLKTFALKTFSSQLSLSSLFSGEPCSLRPSSLRGAPPSPTFSLLNPPLLPPVSPSPFSFLDTVCLLLSLCLDLFIFFFIFMKLPSMSTQNFSISSLELTSPSTEGEVSAPTVIEIQSSPSTHEDSGPAGSVDSVLSSNGDLSSPEWRSNAHLVEDKCLWRSIWGSLGSISSLRISSQGFTKINPATSNNEDHLLNVLPCGEDDCVLFRKEPTDESPDFFFVYGYFFLDLNIKLPFSPFICHVLTFLNVAPCQLQPNAWGFIRCFEILCEHLSCTPTYPLFFLFYKTVTTKPTSVKWVPLLARKNMSRFTALKSHYKVWQKKYFKVMESPEMNNLFRDSDNNPLFPFYWTKNPRRKISVSYDALDESEQAIADYLRTLPVISGHDLIEA
ncbi:uncharacterized protein LOC130731171 isoform X1 [Lotus japonicus]|uniref:uncharacterized protein LOC130731171 isoform X1 n=1 Tax=Lotus japonicus TaxID=34305 RepID=UPI002588ABB9|nr:uncharacterized protein LOC130731171 isoform X1 [Lotus japonicus]